MQLDPERLEEFRNALAAVESSAFGLVDAGIFPGATPYSSRSILLCRFGPEAEILLSGAAARAAALVSARSGVEVEWSVQAEADGGIACWIEYFPGGAHPAAADFALRALQAALVEAAASRSGNPAHARLARAEAERLDKAHAPQVFLQSRFLIAAARRAEIPVFSVGAAHVSWQFGWGSRSDIFYMTASLGDTVPGHQISWRKHVAKQFFRELGLPTSDWRVLGRDGDARRAAEAVGWPCVVKPTDRAFGTGVTANIRTADELNKAVALARNHSRAILIEAHEPGFDHRLMVVDGRLAVAVRREPPAITGDGRSSIADLIDMLNRGRDGSRAAGYLLPVERDQPLAALLAARGLSLRSVLPKGETLALRSTANFSTGGRGVDVTDSLHPQVRGMAELLAKALGLRTAGIDYITPDISRSHAEAGGGFIEVNAMPRLRVLMSEDHPEEEIGALVLGTRPGRIPVTLVAGSEAALAAIAEEVRKRTAATPGASAVSNKWAQVEATELPAAGLDPFAAVAAVLRHRAVDDLTILWSAAQIEEFGLPVDKLDRAIVIDEEIDRSWLVRCREIIAVPDAGQALAALISRGSPPPDS